MASTKWLSGNRGTEFLQFQTGRITREPFPLGGYVYTTTAPLAEKDLYTGNDFASAKAALPQNAAEG